MSDQFSYIIFNVQGHFRLSAPTVCPPAVQKNDCQTTFLHSNSRLALAACRSVAAQTNLKLRKTSSYKLKMSNCNTDCYPMFTPALYIVWLAQTRSILWGARAYITHRLSVGQTHLWKWVTYEEELEGSNVESLRRFLLVRSESLGAESNAAPELTTLSSTDWSARPTDAAVPFISGPRIFFKAWANI